MKGEQPQRQEFTIDGRHFSDMDGFYDEIEQVFTSVLDRGIGRNLNAFNDILRGGFGRHEYGNPIHINGCLTKKASVISGKRLWTPLWKSSWIRTIPDMTAPWKGFDITEKETSSWDSTSTPGH